MGDGRSEFELDIRSLTYRLSLIAPHLGHLRDQVEAFVPASKKVKGKVYPRPQQLRPRHPPHKQKYPSSLPSRSTHALSGRDKKRTYTGALLKTASSAETSLPKT